MAAMIEGSALFRSFQQVSGNERKRQFRFVKSLGETTSVYVSEDEKVQ